MALGVMTASFQISCTVSKLRNLPLNPKWNISLSRWNILLFYKKNLWNNKNTPSPAKQEMINFKAGIIINTNRRSSGQ